MRDREQKWMSGEFGGFRDGNLSICLRGLPMSGRSQIGDVGLIHPKGNGRVYALLSPRNAVHDVLPVPQ